MSNSAGNHRITSHLARSSLSGGIFFILAIFGMTWLIPELWQPQLRNALMLTQAFISVCSVIRIAFFFYSRARNYQVSGFAEAFAKSFTLISSLAWVLYAIYVIRFLGLAPASFFLIAGVVVIANLNAQFSYFDLRYAILTQVASLLPLALVSFSSELKIGWTLNIGALIFLMAGILTVKKANNAFRYGIEAKRALKEERDKFQVLLESVPAAVMWVSKSGDVFTFNKRFQSLIDRLSGGSSSVSPQNLLPEFFAHVKDAMRSNSKIFEFEYNFVFRDDNVEVESATYFFVLERQEHASHQYLLVGLDVSQQRDLETQLQVSHAREMELARLSSLGVMAGGIAHEINNPLFIIRGQVEMLQKSLANAGVDLMGILGSDLFAKIFATIERINKTIRGLRILARDGTSLPKEQINLKEQIDEVTSLFKTRIHQSNSALTIDSTLPSDYPVLVNAVQFTQILFNLLSNAFDEVEKQPDPWIKIQVSLEDNISSQDIKISISNSGRPIEGNALKNLFIPFFTTKEPGKGTGLGLVISRSMAEAHGGGLSYNTASLSPEFILRIPVGSETSSRLPNLNI